jgi:hypothetical protein
MGGSARYEDFSVVRWVLAAGLPEQAQNFRAIFAQEINCAPQPTQFSFDLFNSGGYHVLDTFKTQMHALDVTSDPGAGSVKSLRKPSLNPSEILLRSHLVAHFHNIIPNRFDGASNEADEIVVV